MYKDLPYTVLPSAAPYLSDSAMGQCLMMPRCAVRRDCLHLRKLPHYFADSVQTCEMRRAGFGIFVLPSAIAFTDQSDAEKKIARIAPTTIRKLWSSWVDPWSSRNLAAVFFSSIYHQDCTLGRLFYPIYEVLGKLVYSIAQYLMLRIRAVTQCSYF